MPKPMPVLATLLLLASSALPLVAEAAAANYRRFFNYRPRPGREKGETTEKWKLTGIKWGNKIAKKRKPMRR